MHMENTIQTSTNGLNLTVKAVNTVNQINQMIVDTNQNMNEKMIQVNTQLKLEDLQQEGIARSLNVLA